MGKVFDNLVVHDKGWPTDEYLHSVIKKGNPAVSVPFWSGNHMDVVGEGKDTEASDHILSRIMADDPRNLWFCVWGKSIDLAQALWKLKRDYPFNVDELTEKIFVYDIAGQDACGAWIAGTFPRIKWHRAMYDVISFANVLESIDNIGDLSVITREWWDKNIREVGIMGKLYPIKTHEGNWEGDTPSLLPFIDRGLSDPDGDNLSFQWWRYAEADSYDGNINIKNTNSKDAHFLAPDAPGKTIHIILEVTDDGSPSLTSYRRMIIAISNESDL